jgi:hypothetical protein
LKQKAEAASKVVTLTCQRFWSRAVRLCNRLPDREGSFIKSLRRFCFNAAAHAKTNQLLWEE